MSDPIGTLRLEIHEGGISMWARVEADRRRNEPRWLCVYSTAPGNVGERLAIAEGFMLAGVIPLTPAATIEAAKKVADSDLYRVGDVDPTPNLPSANYCSATSPVDAYNCTRAKNHDGDHVAGDGEVICAVWPQ